MSILEAKRIRTSSTLTCMLVLALALLLPACAAIRAPDRGLPASPERQDAFEYRLLPGDHILVKLIYTPELSEEVVVRPDGGISLPVAGEVQAAGLGPAELAVKLRAVYAGEVERPDVSVMIRSFGGQRVYIGGEVAQPRMLPLDATTTVADAVFAAGGLKDSAAPDSVILLRRGDAPGNFDAFSVDLEAGLFGQRSLPVLRPYDVIYVPKTRIAQLNKYVEMYINRIIPRATSFGATYGIGFD